MSRCRWMRKQTLERQMLEERMPQLHIIFACLYHMIIFMFELMKKMGVDREYTQGIHLTLTLTPMIHMPRDHVICYIWHSAWSYTPLGFGKRVLRAADLPAVEVRVKSAREVAANTDEKKKQFKE